LLGFVEKKLKSDSASNDLVCRSFVYAILYVIAGVDTCNKATWRKVDLLISNRVENT
jgi:hypothetical protein